MMSKIFGLLFVQQIQYFLPTPAKGERDFGGENTSGVFPKNPLMIKSEL